MPEPDKKTCDYPGCQSSPEIEGQARGPYQTDPQCATRAEVTEDMKMHIEVVHTLPLRKQELQVSKYREETERLKVTNAAAQNASQTGTQLGPSKPNRTKLEAIPQPKILHGATESDWGFFKSQWSRYVAGTEMSTDQQIHQLWACCSEDLQCALHNGNSAKITDPNALLENLRLIAVKKVNNLVNIVDFTAMHQLTDETVTAWGTRLNGHAKMCDMLVQCDECEHNVSFAEKMIMYQFVKGLKDTHAQERILEASAQVEGGELMLARTVKLTESFKMGKSSQEYMNTLVKSPNFSSTSRTNIHEGSQPGQITRPNRVK